MSVQDRPIDDRHPLNVLIGGWRGLIESVLPPVLFVLTYYVAGRYSDHALSIAIVVVLLVAALLAMLRVIRKERPIRILTVVLGVGVGAMFAATSGNAVDYFWAAVLGNVATAIAFALSILWRWPLLGVIVGPLMGTGRRWREDPDLLKAYSRASWLWVILSVVRALVRIPLILNDWLGALAVAPVFFYGLVTLTIAGSWVVIKRTLPPSHPGIRHPVLPTVTD